MTSLVRIEQLSRNVHNEVLLNKSMHPTATRRLLIYAYTSPSFTAQTPPPPPPPPSPPLLVKLLLLLECSSWNVTYQFSMAHAEPRRAPEKGFGYAYDIQHYASNGVCKKKERYVETRVTHGLKIIKE